MHAAAHAGFQRHLTASWLVPTRVLDLGGQNVNGSVYGALPAGAVIDVLDIDPGMRVDPDRRISSVIVADARTWRMTPGTQTYDLVMSTELLEHVEGWVDVVATAHAAVMPGGWFVGTCAGPGRAPHGATGAPAPGADEHYANVDPGELMVALRAHFSHAVVEFVCDPMTADLYWRAKA
jgi:SAM-dependent methyltransferase